MEYSSIRVEIIKLRRSWFLWSIPVAIAAAVAYQIGVETMLNGPYVFRLLVAGMGLVAWMWPIYCLYKLSIAVEPKRAVAWAMVALQAIPIVGLVAAFSLVSKAGRIVREQASSGLAQHVAPAD